MNTSRRLLFVVMAMGATACGGLEYPFGGQTMSCTDTQALAGQCAVRIKGKWVSDEGSSENRAIRISAQQMFGAPVGPWVSVTTFNTGAGGAFDRSVAFPGSVWACFDHQCGSGVKAEGQKTDGTWVQLKVFQSDPHDPSSAAGQCVAGKNESDIYEQCMVTGSAPISLVQP
jgi:hypothetical protein